MIWFSIQYSHGPVYLFHEEQTNHLVRESHLREGYLLIGSVVNGRGKTIRTAHNAQKALGTRNHFLLHPRSKLHTTPLHAMLVQKHHSVTSLYAGKYRLSLLFLLLSLGQSFSLSQLWYHLYLYRQIAQYGVKVSSLARGLGFGDDLEYADELTLGRSIVNRQIFRP